MNQMKLIIFMLSILLIKYNAFGQEDTSEKTGSDGAFTFGIKAGAGFSDFSIKREAFTEKKSGGVVSVFINYRPTNFLGISVEPGYIQKGALHCNYSFFYDDPNALSQPYPVAEIFSITSHHARLPLLVSLRLPGDDCCVVPSLNIGGSVSYLFYASSDNLIDYGEVNGKAFYEFIEKNITDKFEPFEYQVLTGIGVEFINPFGDIIIDVNYNVGLSKVNKYSYQSQVYDFSSNSWIVTLGYRFK